ncbi:SDR family NAD(P)-dependent oxidoreductase [Microbacterium sp. No. 7]|uniref:SDR family NAD(P)-dependent oxidoreductase n=1 Tax=Microbacterium sp. No. 7 TaxID=1714373 RepID=UPI0006D1DB65|nr:SDR family NAD(P)-dependent oxidoreductase [Microbacterium sp. No. 7]ALJ21667.1 hypothetical protein AOA12_17925 [Microbacterium sp. No. 7]
MSRLIVTGGASGIGLATVRGMLDRGDRVGAIDLNPASLAALRATFADAVADGRLATAQADVSDEPRMERAIGGFADAFGGIDGIVNNAAIGGAIGPLVDTRVEDWDATFAVVTRGVFIGVKHAARLLIAQGTGGSIVNIGSIAGLIADAGPQAYSVAKAAVIHMSRVFGAELAPHGIAVNTVNPGLIETPINPTSARRTRDDFARAQPWPEAGRPEHVARAVLFLTDPATRFITAETVTVDGGIAGVGHRLGTLMGTNSLQHGVAGMNYGTTGRAADIHTRRASAP